MAGFQVFLYGRFWVFTEAGQRILTIYDLVAAFRCTHATNPFRVSIPNFEREPVATLLQPPVEEVG